MNFSWHTCIEPPLALRGLQRELRQFGLHQVDSFAIDNAFYKRAQGRWSRILLRMRMYLEYPLRLAWQCLWTRGEHVAVVTSNTFYAPWLATLCLTGRQQRVVQVVYDLFPEALQVATGARSNSRFFRFLQGWVKSGAARSHVTVFLGARIRAHALAQWQINSRSCVIPVGSDAEPFADNKPQRLAKDATVVFMYCGHFGAMHDTEILIQGLPCIAQDTHLANRLEFRFHATGPGYSKIKASLPQVQHPLYFAEQLDSQEWLTAMKTAHVAIVTMRPGAEKVVMPSKTYSALAAGQAILAICPPESDLADLVREHDCGWVVPCAGGAEEVRSEKLEFRNEGLEDNGWHQEPTTNNQQPTTNHQPTTTFPKVIQDILSNPEELLRKRRNAFRAGQEVYDMKSVARMWAEVLK